MVLKLPGDIGLYIRQCYLCNILDIDIDILELSLFSSQFPFVLLKKFSQQ